MQAAGVVLTALGVALVASGFSVTAARVAGGLALAVLAVAFLIDFDEGSGP